MSKNQQASEEAMTKRLDAIIRLLTETIKLSNPKFGDTEAIQAMYSVGLTQSEIARILGWKSRGSVNNLLNPKKKKKNGNKRNK